MLISVPFQFWCIAAVASTGTCTLESVEALDPESPTAYGDLQPAGAGKARGSSVPIEQESPRHKSNAPWAGRYALSVVLKSQWGGSALFVETSKRPGGREGGREAVRRGVGGQPPLCKLFQRLFGSFPWVCPLPPCVFFKHSRTLLTLMVFFFFLCCFEMGSHVAQTHMNSFRSSAS